MPLSLLSPLEARVLAVLVEKQHTVPDSYPLSLNALTSGCNQKTARDPVMNASESEVVAALESLKGQHLVFDGPGSRVPRFEQNMGKGLGVPGQSVAILALLILRGPQTAAELRLNTERLHRFADVSSVEGFLDELATREPPLAARLARAPGARESRWAHLLSGAVAQAAPAADPSEATVSGVASTVELGTLRAEQERLRAEVETLRAQVRRLAGEIGVDIDAA